MNITQLLNQTAQQIAVTVNRGLQEESDVQTGEMDLRWTGRTTEFEDNTFFEFEVDGSATGKLWFGATRDQWGMHPWMEPGDIES